MPLYEYQCKNCGRTLEKRQKFSDPPLTVCPYCNGTLEQLISAPAVQFKGGGWYADGYGNKGASKPAASAEGGGSSESSSDASKPAASTDSSSSASPAASTTPASTPAAASTPTPSKS